MEISKTTIWIFFTSKFFGLAPYKLKVCEGGETLVQRSKIFTIYSFSLILVMVCLTYRGLLFDAKSNTPVRASFRMKSNTSKVVTALDVSVVVLSTLSGVVCGFRGLKATQQLNKINYEVDQVLADYRKKHRGQTRAYVMLIVSMLTIFTMLALDVWTWDSKAKQLNMRGRTEENIVWYVPFYSLYFILVALHVHFANSGYGLANRYKCLNLFLKDTYAQYSGKYSEQESSIKNGKLNEELEKITNSLESEWSFANMKMFPQSIGTKTSLPMLTIPMSSTLGMKTFPKSANETANLSNNRISRFATLIDRIAYLHANLGRAVNKVSEAFGMAVVFLLISCLLHLVATAYFLFLELMEKQPKFSYLQFLWIAFHSIRLLMIVEPCHDTTIEAKRTIDIVCEIGRNNHNVLITQSLEKFWQQLMADNPNYSACGLCYIDRNILTSFSSAICTYLVILIQFQASNG